MKDRKESKKSYTIPIRQIIANTNPRNPLSQALQKQGYTVTTANGSPSARLTRLTRSTRSVPSSPATWAGGVTKAKSTTRRTASRPDVANWDSIVFDLGAEPLRRVPMMEPLRGTAAIVDTLLESCATPAELVAKLGA